MCRFFPFENANKEVRPQVIEECGKAADLQRKEWDRVELQCAG